MSTGASSTEYNLTKILAGVILAVAVVALSIVAILQPAQLATLAGRLIPVAMGALSILGGAYAISRGQAKSGGPPVAGILLPLVLCAGLAGGCAATSTAQRMTLVGQGTNIAWTRGYPIIDLACKAEATKCVKPGELVPLAACPGASKCIDALKLFQRSLDTADRALLVGLPLAAVDSPGAAQYLTAALKAYEQAMLAASAWGLR